MNHHKEDRAVDGQQCPSTAVQRWLAFGAGLFLIWVFMFVMAPWIEKTPAVKPLTDFIEERGIDASALYYTEVEEASIAELSIRSTMEYPPKGP